MFKSLGLLSSKPVLYVCNVEEAAAGSGNAYSSAVEARVDQNPWAAPSHILRSGIPSNGNVIGRLPVLDTGAPPRAHNIKSCGKDSPGLDHKAKMKRITVTLSARFHQWRLENPHEILAMTTTQDTKTIVSEMSDDVFDGILERIRKEGGSLAQWKRQDSGLIAKIEVVPQNART